MKLPLAALLLVLAAQPASAADAAPTADSVRELLAASQSSRMLDMMKSQMDSAMQAGMRQGLGDTKLTPEQQKIVDDMRQRMVVVMTDEIAWDKIEPLVVDVYARIFTQHEIDGLIAFYRSEAGTAYIAKMPAAVQEMMQRMQAHMATVVPKLKQIQQEGLERLQATQHADTAK